jgi:hypothetical protein
MADRRKQSTGDIGVRRHITTLLSNCAGLADLTDARDIDILADPETTGILRAMAMRDGSV